MFWIPAFAGMTPVAAGRRRVALDSRPVSGHGVTLFRGNDEGVGMIQGQRLY